MKRKLLFLVSLVISILIYSISLASNDINNLYELSLDKVEKSASEGNFALLTEDSYDAVFKGIDNDLTIQEICYQITFLVIISAAGSGHDIQLAIRSAIFGISNAHKKIVKDNEPLNDYQKNIFELDIKLCSIESIRASSHLFEAEGYNVDLLIDLDFNIPYPDDFEIPNIDPKDPSPV